MKRGLIAWDHDELPVEALSARLDAARVALEERDVPALVVYTDVWRSNYARHFTNYMPYWNRSLAVIPREGEPVLLCGLSPRVYPWIRSTTVFEEIRPARNPVDALLKLAGERGWQEVGVLELARLPHEIHGPLSASSLLVHDVAVPRAADEATARMYERAAVLALGVLEQELPHGKGLTDHQFTGRLERALRLAGAEDLVILISAGDTVPRTPCGATLGVYYSVSVALEYRGHWVKCTRAQGPAEAVEQLRQRFAGGAGIRESCSGSYPFEPGAGGTRDALTVEVEHGGKRLFYGGSVTLQSTPAGQNPEDVAS